MEFYQKSKEDVSNHFKTNIDFGLSFAEAMVRLSKFGKNQILRISGPSAVVVLVRQIINPLMIILLCAIVASCLIGHYQDALIISFAVVLTAIVGFIQEWKAEQALDLLKSYEVDYCRVKREGQFFRILTTDLVPGDIVSLEPGTRVAADMRLVVTQDLYVQESLLTGEAQPVFKNVDSISDHVTIGDRKNMVYMGTFVLGGVGEGIVVETGSNTYLGTMAHLLQKTKHPKTPLEQQITRISMGLGIAFCCVTTIVSCVGYLRGMLLGDVVITGIALAVAAIPESLPVAITVILAIGMRRMVKHNALIRRLIAAETLGSVSVICTDKTGTLTQGNMQVVWLCSQDQILNIEEVQPSATQLTESTKKLLLMTLYNCDIAMNKATREIVGQPTEVAIAKLARFFHLDHWLKEKHQRIQEIPFSSEKKFKATIHLFGNEALLVVKGAPEKIFDLCVVDDFCTEMQEHIKTLSEQGLRLLVVAAKRVTSNAIIMQSLNELQCLGLIAFKDPLRKQAATTVDELTEAGIHLVVVTGDHAETSFAIAKEVGLDVQTTHVMTGSELNEVSEKDFVAKVKDISVFARVDPSHKIKIVKAWQSLGVSVAMVGDGVNDSPALKAADIGVALGSGSDVTRDISDMVLLDNNLATISKAVYEGRVIFDNMRKVIVYLLAQGIAETGFIGLSVILGFPLPLLAMQIFCLNLITDALPYIALTVDHGDESIMKRRPFSKNESLLNNKMFGIITTASCVIVAGLFGHFALLLYWGFDLMHLRSILFTALVFDSLLFSFSVRYLYTPWFTAPKTVNYYLIAANSLGLGLQCLVLYVPWLQKFFSTVPLYLNDWVLVICFGFIKITVLEILKVFFLTSTFTPVTILQDKN